jgi:hypothetical protein
LSQWISEFVAGRRQQPRRHDVVDGVLQAEIDGRPVTLGPHRCAGSNLARMNMRVALQELVPLDDVALQEGAEVHYHSTTTRAPLAVPISFTPGRPLGVAAA